MALNTQVSDTAANAAANALATLCNNGYLRIYDSTGAGQPANANTAVTSQVRLANLRFGATAWGGASGGVLTANAIASDTNAVGGTATWFRVLESDGATVVFDGSVGVSGCNLNINSTSIQTGTTVAVTAFTHSLLESASGY